jgi:hypothetical protein
MTRTIGRLKTLAAGEVGPFAVLLDPPIPGESLLGFTNRCFARTPAKQAVQGLALAGIGKLTPTGLATTLDDPVLVEGLATLLRTSKDEIGQRLYRPCKLDNGRSAAIDFFGTRIRADYRDSRLRRMSPRALKISPHHRAVWDLRIFSFDPETREPLIDTCPECSRPLGWRRAYGIANCDWCLDPETRRPLIDLRNYPRPPIEVEDEEAIDFVTGLIDPDPHVKSFAAGKAARDLWANTTPSELFEVTIAFACALTMKTDKRRTTLERPKTVESYKRFTPDVLAAAGRTIIDGAKGFTAIAGEIRADAIERPGFYGVKKELLPLFCLTVDQHLTQATKDIIKNAIKADMQGTRSGIALRRNDYAGDERYLAIEAFVAKTGLHRKCLSRLADSGRVTVITAADAKQAPKMMPVAEVMPLVEIFNDSIHQKHAAGLLDIGQCVLPDLEARGLIHRVDGAATALFETDDVYYRAAEVVELAGRIEASIPKDAVKANAMRISKAVKRLGMTPVPWGAVIAAIVSGKAPLCRMPGDNKTWRTGTAAMDVRSFVKAVQAELCDTDAAEMDDWIGNQTVAEILGITEVFVSLLAKTGRLDRNGPNLHRLFDRGQVEVFSNTYIFVPEIMKRARITRARDVREWLADREVELAFQLSPNRYLAFARKAVEQALAREAVRRLQATE